MVVKIMHTMGIAGIFLIVGLLEGGGLSPMGAMLAFGPIAVLIFGTMKYTGWYDFGEKEKALAERQL